MKRSPIRRRSRKSSAAHARYVRWVQTLSMEDSQCHVGPLISAVEPTYRDCSGVMDGLHHLRKRSQGGAVMDPENVIRSCNPCNLWVEDHPTLAHRAGLVIRHK